MTTIKLSEAKAHLGSYAKQAAKGKEYVISLHNTPLAMLTACPQAPVCTQPKLGLMEGAAIIPSDFDQPMADFESDFYGS